MKKSYAFKKLKPRHIAKELDISTAAVYAWPDEIPEARAKQLKEIFSRLKGAALQKIQEFPKGKE